MKLFVVFACALAAASAGYVAPVVYSQAQHLPVIGANGVPVETAEVQHAKAAHYLHKADAHARNGDFVSAYVHGSPVVSAYSSPVYSGVAHTPVVVKTPEAYPTTYGHPGNVNGVPLETPEVVAAKSNHFAAHVEAHARNGDFVAPVVSTYAHGSPVVAASPVVQAYSSPVHTVVSKTPEAYPTTYGHPGNVNGVPLETPEVVAAKSNHFAAHVEAHARNGDFVAPVVSAYAHGSPVVAASPVVQAYSSPVHTVVAKTPEAYPTTYGHPGNVNGVPLETPEVVAAKSNHFAAHLEAHARNGDFATEVVAPVVSTYSAQTPVVSSYSTHGSLVSQTPVVSAYSSPVYAPVHGVVAHAPAAYPTTLVHPGNVNGVPLETPEVVAAKSKHFAAHSEALVRNGDAHVLYRHRRGVYTPVAYSAYNYGAFPYGYTTPVVHHY
ncbi:PREDICTED: uncharacterized protein LOC108558252 [Nicrophorus vespilloides]|uniref:Uncharacterized protein LOC108558252 n=1 Tax=Nicrophorus vespilloides TaxID=110193 RepID=A0ABM1M7N6_NICVS|nr:PREDICTED: uncharacterized protein LOC108558252 [Nicrophorus vespilloides]